MADFNFTGFGVHLKVASIDRSRKFYESLGLKAVFAYGDEEFRATLPEGVPSAPERYRGMTFRVGESGELEIAEGHIAVEDQSVFSGSVPNAKISAMIKVSTLLPLLENPNLHIKFPIRHYYWGSIEIAVKDPDGFVLVFIAPYSEEEFAEVSKKRSIEVILPPSES